MKVGIVVPYSWSFWGGVQEHADHQARALQQLGHDARIVMGHDPPGRLTWLLHPKQGRHTRPPEYVIPVGRSVIVPANASLPNIILSPQSMVRMRRIWEQERFDVVHVHEPYAPILSVYALAIGAVPDRRHLPLGRRAARLVPGRRAVLGRPGRPHRLPHRRVGGRAPRGRAPRRLARSTSSRTGSPCRRSSTPTGVTATSSSSAGTSPARVCLSSSAPGRTCTQRTGARLRLVGADPLSVRWLARRQRFDLDGVDLLGGLSEDELTTELQRASLLVAPSLGGESFGMVLTRAFACATPVVASDIEGYAQVADHGETGILVPPGDAQALAHGGGGAPAGRGAPPGPRPRARGPPRSPTPGSGSAGSCSRSTSGSPLRPRRSGRRHDAGAGEVEAPAEPCRAPGARARPHRRPRGARRVARPRPRPGRARVPRRRVGVGRRRGPDQPLLGRRTRLRLGHRDQACDPAAVAGAGAMSSRRSASASSGTRRCPAGSASSPASPWSRATSGAGRERGRRSSERSSRTGSSTSSLRSCSSS